MEKEPRIHKYRKPRQKVYARKLTREVSEITGFSQKDVLTVFETYLDLINKNLLDVKQVGIPKVGTVYPTILKGRTRVALHGGVKEPEKIWVPDMFVLKIKPDKKLKESLKKMEVTEDHLNEIYYK